MGIDRRTVLKFGLGGAALLALGGVGLGLRGTVARDPRAPLKVLDARQYAILFAVAQTVCPGSDVLPTAEELDVAGKVDALLDRMHPGDAAEFAMVLGVLENALVGLALDQRITTFTGSTPAQRTRILEGMRTSRLTLRRTMYTSLAGLCLGAYWGNPKVYAYVGYRGPPPYGAAAHGKVPHGG